VHFINSTTLLSGEGQQQASERGSAGMSLAQLEGELNKKGEEIFPEM
jgi:hypothetical protein